MKEVVYVKDLFVAECTSRMTFIMWNKSFTAVKVAVDVNTGAWLRRFDEPMRQIWKSLQFTYSVNQFFFFVWWNIKLPGFFLTYLNGNQEYVFRGPLLYLHPPSRYFFSEIKSSCDSNRSEWSERDSQSVRLTELGPTQLPFAYQGRGSLKKYFHIPSTL